MKTYLQDFDRIRKCLKRLIGTVLIEIDQIVDLFLVKPQKRVGQACPPITLPSLVQLAPLWALASIQLFWDLSSPKLLNLPCQ